MLVCFYVLIRYFLVFCVYQRVHFGEMIDSFGGFVVHNLVVMCATLMVLFKLVVLRLLGDTEGQGGVALAMPEDLCYVTLGLILGDCGSNAGNLRRHFRDDVHSQHIGTDLAVVIAFTIFVALVVRMIALVTNENYKLWKAATHAFAKNRDKEAAMLQGQTSGLQAVGQSADRSYMLLVIRHTSIMGVTYCLQYFVIVSWLSWLAKVVAGPEA